MRMCQAPARGSDLAFSVILKIKWSSVKNR